ncbi:MAG: hypothetical protein KKD38_08255 [Candidatus Delongbacteria bacterium]|nr:hypothetical protein [Candidatus Delongbacteria bacterium]MCG2760798.1 hypothetical protein [Candidatus Delongbacteria bacterium]
MKTGILIIVFTLLISACTSSKAVESDGFLYMEEVYAHAKNSFNSGKWDDAINWYDRLDNDYPENQYRDEILFVNGYIYKSVKNDPEKASLFFNELIENYPDSEFYNSAEFELLHINEPDYMPKFEK